MSQTKRDIEEREQARHDAAKRDNRRCESCSSVIPYGTDGCPNCAGTLRDD